MSNIKLKAVDVAVVGVGVAGTIICKELAQAGLKVVALERGRVLNPRDDFAIPYAHDQLKYGTSRSDLMQNLSRETITFRNEINETALPIREIVASFKPGECVGGAGVHWGGATHRFLPWDFQTLSCTLQRYGKQHIPEDCTSQDWGITYDELEPYYDQFEYLYGVGGKAGNLNGVIQPGGNPFEGPRSREYPNPPARLTYSASLLIKAAEALGYRPFPRPTATMTRPYVNPYRLTLGPCISGGYCAGYGCATGAKATPLTTVLPALSKHGNFELRAHANVIKINLDSARKRAVAVTYVDARGRELEQPAELVILTSFVFNNTRLMLLSGIGKPYDPTSNRGVVGRNYANQIGGSAAVFFEELVFNPFMGGGGGVLIDELNGDNLDHTGLGFMGGAFLAVVDGREGTPIKHHAHPVPSATPHWGSGWKRAVTQSYRHSFSIGSHGACQSYRTNYLDLDPTYKDAFGLPLLRMTMSWRDNEQKMSAYMTAKAAEIAAAMSPSQMKVSPVVGKYNITSSGNTHNCGGAVMGAEPATSAVNKYLQSWDVPNVFVVGSSAFPQNSANGPTGTVGALACWAADAIKERYLKQPGLLA